MTFCWTVGAAASCAFRAALRERQRTEWVKSVFICRPGYKDRFSVGVCQQTRSGSVAYKTNEIDFIVAYVAPFDTWYVIPVKVLLGRKVIYVYPQGKRRKNAGLYEIYREAWHLLTNCHPEGAPLLRE